MTPERQFPVSWFSLAVDRRATRIQIAVFATNPRPLRNPHVSRGAPLPCETFSVPQAVQEKLSGRPHAQDSICWFRSGLRLVIMCHLRWPIESGLESLQVARRFQPVPYATERKTILGNKNKPFPDGG